MEFLFANTLVSLVKVAFFFAFAWAIGRFIFKYDFPRWSYSAAAVVMVASVWWNVTGRDAPRFVLTDEAGAAPVVSGEIKDTRPDRLSDDEREAENQRLYEQNQTDNK